MNVIKFSRNMQNSIKIIHGNQNQCNVICVLFLFLGLFSLQCRMGSIRSGYRLKRGLDQDNITPLGTHSSLDGCHKICCLKDFFDYGMYDGSQCYGITCESDVDKRCVLLRDGNARFTIFKINKRRKKRKKEGKISHKQVKKKSIASKKNDDAIKRNSKSINKRTFSKTQSHRKHNKRRSSKKHHKTSKRDFSASYSLSNETLPYTRVNIKPINHITSLPFQPIADLTTNRIDAGNSEQNSRSKISLNIPPVSSPDIYNKIARDMISTVPSLDSKSTIKPNAFDNTDINSFIRKNVPGDSASNSKYQQLNTPIPKQKAISFQTPLPNNQKELVFNSENSVQQSALLQTPRFQEVAVENSTPSSTNLPPKKMTLSKTFFMGTQVKPLTEFGMDTQSIESRDVIPRPEDDDTNDRLITKDSFIDVPFSSDLQIQNTTSNYPSGEGLSNNYLSKTSQHPPSHHASHMVFTPYARFPPQLATSNKTSAVQHHSYKSSYFKSKHNTGRPESPQGRHIRPLMSEGGDQFNENIPLAFQIDHNNNNPEKIKSPSNSLKRNDMSRGRKEPINVRKAISEINELRRQIEGLLSKKSTRVEKPRVKTQPNFSLIGRHKQHTHKGCVNPIGVYSPSFIDDNQMTSSSNEIDSPASKGRLNMKPNPDINGAWCAQTNATIRGENPYLQIDFKKNQLICRIASQGSEDKEKWVKRYRLTFSEDGNAWSDYSEKGNRKLFVGNEDASDTTYHSLTNPISARYIRFIPVTWSGTVPCMRVEVFNSSVNTVEEKTSRSNIPKGHVGLIIDLDFEKIDDSIVLDRSSFGNNGILYGGAKIFDSHSACRHAVKLPLGADIVIDGTLMKKQPREAITIAVWIQLNKVDGLHSIFDTVGGHSTHNLGQFHFEVVGGDVRWFHRNESQIQIFSIITDHKMIRPMEWNHIAATYDANRGIATIFVNGTLAVTGRGNGLISKDWEQRVGIGRHKGVRFLNGQIDEFKMYDIVLDPREIAELATKCDHDKYYCGTTMTEPSGALMSPSFPETFVGPVQCEWNIEARTGEIISLDMQQFHLGQKGSCGRGTLEVRDKIRDNLIGSYCGSPIMPRKVKSHSNHLYLKYTTHGAFAGENFKIGYTKEKKNLAKKSLPNQCKSSAIMKNVTLIGGAKAGNFSDLGYAVDMEDCVDRCCNSGDCDVAFMIDDNCYSVKCLNAPMCKIRPAKASTLHPQLAFVSIAGQDSVIADMVKSLIKTTNPATTSLVDPNAVPLCPHTPIQSNVTLIGGIKSGNFTSHGVVGTFDECVKYCCGVDTCDVAFMVKRTCFSLQCANTELCKTRTARPSPYNPMVSFMKKMHSSSLVTVGGATKTKIIPANQPIELTTNAIDIPTAKLQSCKDVRVSKVYLDVTLKGGINSGEFTDKGHVTSIDECTAKCCAIESCNVAFIIKDTCFAVKCKSYSDCELKPAVSEYYKPKIVYVSWSPPKDDLGDGVPYSYRGCWKDFDITAFAIPLLEGTDSHLSEPYKKRPDPVGDCASVSQSKNFKVFAIQNGGACFSGEDAEHTYQRYGKSEACKGGKGGPFANSVYKSFDDGSIIALGCWADLQDRAFRRMEKNDPLLKDPIDSRADPIGVCAKVAEKMKVKNFALQKGGQCFIAKDNQVTYDKYSPSRKCKYGLGGQMANDVYQLRKNFSDKAIARHNISTTFINVTSGSLSPDEIIYKEETSGNDLLRYVYKYDKPLDNVTLMSAINAGTFEDKGKMEHMEDCIKACGESSDCDVAFMLSSQCFNVHCYSRDTCKVKPAFSSFYKPQLAYVYHRLMKSSKNESTLITKSDCNVDSQASNVTFIEGINAGNFSDMGHAGDMNECKSRCCSDPKCNIAFLIQADCYGVRCYSKESCKTRSAKNAALFQPKMVLIRPVSSPLDESIQKNSKSFYSTTTIPPTDHDSTDDAPTRDTQTTTHHPTTTTSTTTSPPPPTITKCKLDMWDGHMASNQTLIGGINAGDFRDHGQVESMSECMGYCCGEQDCDLSFMIDKDCYTVKCYKPSLCKTRNAKPTTFTPQIAFKTSSKSAIEKADLSELLPLHNLPSPENGTAELSFAAFRSILFGLPDKYNGSAGTRPVWTNREISASLNNGINEALDFVQDTVTELTTDKDSLEHPFSILYSGLSTTPTAPSTSPTSQSSTNHKTHTIIPRPGTTPSSSILHPSSQATPTFGDPKKHSCRAEPIIYNATLRLGMHSGLFTKLGRVKTMDDCIERCCRSSNADVAYMLGPFCFAVKCRTREMCKPSPAMYSDISSLNLNPAISFLSKEKMIPVLEDGILLDKAFHQNDDDLIAEVAKNMTFTRADLSNNLTSTMTVFDGFSVAMVPAGINRAVPSFSDATCADSPITYNVTLRGGVHAGKFTELGEGISMRTCVGKCCDTPLCDVAFMFSDKCYAVGCYDESQCQAVLAKPSSLNPKLAYVTKYRTLGMTSLDVVPSSGIEFDVKQDDYCVTNLQHGPVYTNKTLFGGMKAGNFSFLGNVNDMASCLRKCCSRKDCDMAYLVNKQQCFSVKCFSPELCQISNNPLKQKMIEISKLVRPKKRTRRLLSRGTTLAYIGIGLIIITSGLTGIIWAALLYIKRSRLKSAEREEMDLDIPRPDR